MSEAKSNREDWEACEPEYLAVLSRQAHSAKQRRSVLRKLSGAVVVCVVALGVWGLRPAAEDQGMALGGVTCGEARLHLVDYRAGKLSDELAARVDIHLRECPDCQTFMRQMEGGRTAAAAGRGRSICPCARCQAHRSASALVAGRNVGGQARGLALAQLALLD